MFDCNLFPEPRVAPVTFEIGQMVLVRNIVKGNFGQTWVGQLPSLERNGETVYTIDRNGSEGRVHLKDIRPAPPETKMVIAKPPENEEEAD